MTAIEKQQIRAMAIERLQDGDDSAPLDAQELKVYCKMLEEQFLNGQLELN